MDEVVVCRDKADPSFTQFARGETFVLGWNFIANNSCDRLYVDVDLDYLVNALPSTIETTGLLSPERLSACKPSCVFINVAR